ncbi:MAG: triacylglycerol lipase [Cressdnaviricota sp.]|nr:MAG: triacylglycerol lipase [Cressdnaviricota sp.]
MDVSGQAFSNQLMYFNNPTIAAYDSSEFNPESQAESHPLHHEISVESYKSPSERRRNIVGFQYDDQLSDRRHAVYRHAADKRVIMGSRGTNPKELRDLYSDAALTIGQFKGTKHYKTSVKKYQQVQDKYGPNQSYHLSGHSLGAHNTYALANRYPNSTQTSVGFNQPGSLPGLVSSGIQNIYQTPTQKKVDKFHVMYNNTLDPVSILSRHRKIQRNQKAHHSWNPHSLQSWYNY